MKELKLKQRKKKKVTIVLVDMGNSYGDCDGIGDALDSDWGCIVCGRKPRLEAPDMSTGADALGNAPCKDAIEGTCINEMHSPIYK